MIFVRFSKKIGCLGIFGPPSYGIGANIRIGPDMLCLPYAGFFKNMILKLAETKLEIAVSFFSILKIKNFIFSLGIIFCRQDSFLSVVSVACTGRHS